MPDYSHRQFFFSISTAIIVGVSIAYIGITGFQFLKNGGSIKNFSNAVSYAAEDVQEEVSDDITLSNESLTIPTNSSPIPISALAYSVQSLDKDNVLVEKDSERVLPIASITKLITAVVAKKLFTDDDTVTITTKMLSTEGNTGHLRLGEKFKIGEILYPLLLVSSNDAAVALSQSYDSHHGSGKFVMAMNDWAKSIGAYRTYFRDASGLSPDNVSTAHDLSLITKWIKENKPEIFYITLTNAKTIRTHTWVNPTHFLSLSSYTGGKNGFTTEAHLTSISLFALGSPKRLYSVVLLGSKARDRDTLALLNEAVK